MSITRNHTSAIAVAAILMANLLGVIAFLTVQSAYAQSSSMQGSTQSQIVYKTAYPKVNADSRSSVTVQSEFHIYKPGETVRIAGSVSNEVRQETKSDTVQVRLLDAQGMVIANQQARANNNGEYSATVQLPANAREGEYSAGAKVEVAANVLGLLNAEIAAKLESSTPVTFTVAKESTFAITVQIDGSGSAGTEEEFQVKVASNSTVSAVALQQEEKMVTFTVDGETGTRGVTQVTIPKAMLSGEMMVMIDGQVVPPDSNDVIVKSNTETETTFEINYSHSTHEVSVTGTNIVPEFPISMLVMAGAIGSIVAVVTIARKRSASRNKGTGGLKI